jgi:hypothetical protein
MISTNYCFLSSGTLALACCIMADVFGFSCIPAPEAISKFSAAFKCDGVIAGVVCAFTAPQKNSAIIKI